MFGLISPTVWIALAAFVAGGVANGWRLNASHAEAMQAEKDRYATLAQHVTEQNTAIDKAKVETEAAQKVADEAKKRADERKPIIQTRIQRVMDYAPKDCEEAR
jgi:hypothetical protein